MMYAISNCACGLVVYRSSGLAVPKSYAVASGKHTKGCWSGRITEWVHPCKKNGTLLYPIAITFYFPFLNPKKNIIFAQLTCRERR